MEDKAEARTWQIENSYSFVIPTFIKYSGGCILKKLGSAHHFRQFKEIAITFNDNRR